MESFKCNRERQTQIEIPSVENARVDFKILMNDSLSIFSRNKFSSWGFNSFSFQRWIARFSNLKRCKHHELSWRDWEQKMQFMILMIFSFIMFNSELSWNPLGKCIPPHPARYLLSSSRFHPCIVDILCLNLLFLSSRFALPSFGYWLSCGLHDCEKMLKNNCERITKKKCQP